MEALHRFFLLLCFLWGMGVVQSQTSLSYYSMNIDFPKGGSMSGICIIRMEANEGMMTVMNEFGIKAFDAFYSKSKGKVKLFNVIKMLDKKIIRKVISNDIALLFDAGRSKNKYRTSLHVKNGNILLTNRRFRIRYNLQPIRNVVE